MDVSKKSILLLSLSLFIFGCNKSEPTQVFSLNEDQNCQDRRVNNEFLVRWKSGAVTLEKFDGDHEKFIEEFVTPNLDLIEKAEYNHKIFNITPYSAQSVDTQGGSSSYNWGASLIRAEYAWQNDVRGEGIVVAVIDDGVNIDHPKLANRIFLNEGESGLDLLGQSKSNNGIDDDQNGYIDDFAGYNFAQQSPHNQDTGQFPYRGHGSHVAGTIAAEHFDKEVSGIEVQGIAPKAQILPLDFIDDAAGGSVLEAIQAIEYAVQMGAKIINASWGGKGCSEQLSFAIQKLSDSNVLFIAAAGNSGNDIDQLIHQEYPAAFVHANQITVGSVGRTDFMANHSNFGIERVNLFAPGVDIASTIPPSGDQEMTGTSMATPHVAGAAALLWSAKPNATAQEIKSLLLQYSSYNSSYLNTSRGRLDVQNSLQALINP